MFILWFTDFLGTARYLLVVIVPLFILATGYVDRLINNLSVRKEKIISIVITTALILLELIFSDYWVLTDRSIPYFAHENEKYEQIVEFVNTQPEKHIFVINDNGQPEVYRIMDNSGDKEYLVYLTETQTIEVHDYYWHDEYYDWLDDGFLLVGCDTNTSIDMMPDDIVARSEKYVPYRIFPFTGSKQNKRIMQA